MWTSNNSKNLLWEILPNLVTKKLAKEIDGLNLQEKNFKNYNEINEKYDFLHKNIMEVINKALMREQTKKGNENEKDTPWITTGILKSVKTKNILPKQCFRNKGLYTYHTRHTGTK